MVPGIPRFREGMWLGEEKGKGRRMRSMRTIVKSNAQGTSWVVRILEDLLDSLK